MPVKTRRKAKPVPKTLRPAQVMALLRRIEACHRRNMVRGKWAVAAWNSVKRPGDIRFVARCLGVSFTLRERADARSIRACRDLALFSKERYQAYCDAYRKVITVPMLLKAAHKQGLI
jgi:hypothetical protein